ncbi:COG3904 family protein [Anianabacter salinae]|uniref:COG3904 family protein n=1 Tax=Anianabacter salinae TaxID=2851023 RepID=UPI00225E6E62|nr:hypothetical protein [Anianabacter salinae]MBV0912829.1 hypothetical protein [Anianabacter salinae]
MAIADRISAGGAIKAILAVQLGIAAILVAGDVGSLLPRLVPGPDAPRLTETVRPGDQTRRYDPADRPTLPADPSRTGVPASREMPSRLQFDGGAAEGFEIWGQIAPGDAERFTDWLALQEEVTALRLDSPGGSVADALTIGRAIREAGIATELVAGAVCLSACPYILSGGAVRRVAPDAFVGVHQHYFGESTVLPAFMAVESIQRGQAEVVEYLDDMGIDLRLMRHSLATPPGEIYILVQDELRDYGIVTPEA